MCAYIFVNVDTVYVYMRWGSFPTRSDPPQTGCFYARCSFVTLDPWGASPFLFFPALSPVFSTFSSSISCPCVFSYSSPPPPIPAYASCVTSLFLLHLRQVAQFSVPRPFLADIACHYVSLCRSLIFIPPPSFLFPSATVTGAST